MQNKSSLQKILAVFTAAALSLGLSTATHADVKFNKVEKSQKHRSSRDYNREVPRTVRRGRYGQQHVDFSKDPNYRSSRHSNRRHNDRRYDSRYNSRYDRNYNRNYNRQWDRSHDRYDRRDRYDSRYYRRPVLTNCRYVYDRRGYRVKRCYPARYRYDVHDRGYYHGRRFHDRYGVYYSSYDRGRYHHSHRGHRRAGYYYDTRAGEWIALAILFDRLLD